MKVEESLKIVDSMLEKKKITLKEKVAIEEVLNDRIRWKNLANKNLRNEIIFREKEQPEDVFIKQNTED